MEIVSYLFSPIPGSAFNYWLYVYIYASVLIALAIGFIVLIKIKKDNKALRKTYKSAPSEFLWMGITIAILTASRTNGIPYLSMRFLLFIIVALSFYYIIKNIHRLFKKYPEMKEVVKPKIKKQEKTSYSTKK